MSLLLSSDFISVYEQYHCVHVHKLGSLEKCHIDAKKWESVAEESLGWKSAVNSKGSNALRKILHVHVTHYSLRDAKEGSKTKYHNGMARLSPAGFTGRISHKRSCSKHIST